MPPLESFRQETRVVGIVFGGHDLVVNSNRIGVVPGQSSAGSVVFAGIQGAVE